MRGTPAETPWWLRIAVLEAWEGDEDDDSEDEDDSENEDDDSEDDDEAGNEGSGDNDKDIEGLKSALVKERKDRKRVEKELRKIQKQQERKNKAEESEVETLREENILTKAKLSKVGDLLVKSAVDTAIIEAATTAKFRDVSDALDLVDRSEIEVELDLDDDEVSFEFDKNSVVSAVNALAKKKPHLILADGDEEPSGGKPGSKKGKKGDQDLTEETLKNRYPALRV